MTPQEEGRLMAVVEQLAKTVPQLSSKVEQLVAQQNYWKGGLAVLSMVSGAVGAAVSAVVSWLK